MLEKLIEAIVRIAAALELIAAKEAGGMDMARPGNPVVVGADPAAPGGGQTAVVNAEQTAAGQIITPVTAPVTTHVTAPDTAASGTTPETKQFINDQPIGPGHPQYVAPVQQQLNSQPALERQQQQAAGTAPNQAGAAGVWDPTTAEIQGSYRTKDKKDAINTAIVQLGIQAAKSWSFAKKHQAILDHVSQFGAVQQLTWADFEQEIQARVAVVGRDVVLGVVQQLEGHQVVAEPNIQPANYQKILDMTAPEKHPDIRNAQLTSTAGVNQQQPAMTAQQPADYQPGMVVNTPDLLAAYSRYLIVNGADPKAIQDSIAHIAPGITYVPVEQVPAALQAINAATVNV
jgi:hypothetical protein